MLMRRSATAPAASRPSWPAPAVVTLVAQGRTDAQIAAHLSVSVRTVSSRLGHIRDRPGAAAGPT